VLDIGFSSCTVPTFCCGPGILNISPKGKVWAQGLEFGVQSLSEGNRIRDTECKSQDEDIS